MPGLLDSLRTRFTSVLQNYRWMLCTVNVKLLSTPQCTSHAHQCRDNHWRDHVARKLVRGCCKRTLMLWAWATTSIYFAVLPHVDCFLTTLCVRQEGSAHRCILVLANVCSTAICFRCALHSTCMWRPIRSSNDSFASCRRQLRPKQMLPCQIGPCVHLVL